MKFCVNCDNMYYIGISVEDQKKLIYYCRNCKHKDETITEEGVCVLNSQLKKGKSNLSHIINKYTKMDPTIPRIYNMKCPNMDCVTNKEKGENNKTNEIIYVRYDDDNLKYAYVCVDCDTVWKTNENK